MVSDKLAALRHLHLLGQGMEVYARTLMVSGQSDVVRAGGALLLLGSGRIQQSDVDALLALGQFGAVRNRAFEYFEGCMEHDIAAQFAAMIGNVSLSDIASRIMRATIDRDFNALAHEHARRYLERGSLGDLRVAASHSEKVGGWCSALTVQLEALAVSPLDQDSASVVARSLEASTQYELLEEFLALLRPIRVQRPTVDIHSAAILLARDRAADCLDLLASSEKAGKARSPGYAIGPLGEHIRARALQRLERFADAHKAFAAMNNFSLKAAPPPGLAEAARQFNALPIPPLAPAGRRDVVMMLGFPRSGTTLLENVLATHPQVETHEELPTLHAAMSYIDRGSSGLVSEKSGSPELYVAARERYFREMARYASSGAAKVSIDKLPLRSIHAPLLKKLIPDQRYIFSIRHPYDVIISCFQQRFALNPAMASFLKIETAIALYDATMTAWFSAYAMDSREVAYVRYENLVEQFRPTVAGVLEFLDLEWDDAVESFAEAAMHRSAKTPSYKKVRQGLSIGVQTYWKNYDFLFNRPEAEPLTKWAKFFGYETI